jgi:hypothetical protein
MKIEHVHETISQLLGTLPQISSHAVKSSTNERMPGGTSFQRIKHARVQPISAQTVLLSDHGWQNPKYSMVLNLFIS